eukprot:420108_1
MSQNILPPAKSSLYVSGWIRESRDKMILTKEIISLIHAFFGYHYKTYDTNCLLYNNTKCSFENKYKHPPIGISLGNTNICSATYGHKSIRISIIPTNTLGHTIIPSCISYLDHSTVLIGFSALWQKYRNSTNTIQDLHKLIHEKTTYDKEMRCIISAYVKHFAKSLIIPNEMQQIIWIYYFKEFDTTNYPFNVKIAHNNTLSIQIQHNGKNKLYSIETVYSKILKHVKQTVNSHIHRTSNSVTNTVLAIPSYFTNIEKQFIKTSAQLGGWHVTEIIDEQIAAVMAYELEKVTSDTISILIFDLGATTLDISILTITNGVYKYLAINTSNIGGNDIDNILLEYFLQQFQTKNKIKSVNSKRSKIRLLRQCRRTKHKLSKNITVAIELDSFYDAYDFSSSITRIKFDDLCSIIFGKCVQKIEDTLKETNIKTDDINYIILCGGSCNIPFIRKKISEYNLKNTNAIICDSINFDEVVARGTAIKAAILCGQYSNFMFELGDCIELNIGVEVEYGIMSTMIKRGSVTPVKTSMMFNIDFDNICLNGALIRVYQGQSKFVEGNFLLGEFELLFSNVENYCDKSLQIKIEIVVDSKHVITVTATNMMDENNFVKMEIKHDFRSISDIKANIKTAEQKYDQYVKRLLLLKDID